MGIARSKDSEDVRNDVVPEINIKLPDVVIRTPDEGEEDGTKSNRQKLKLDLGLKIVPEIRVNSDCEEPGSYFNEPQKIEENGNEENKATFCDKIEADTNGLNILPQSPLTNSNEGSFSPSCTLMQNLIIN